jgi:CelD/BcsL family acetyltransferase involved in cellulose biosynthesis
MHIDVIDSLNDLRTLERDWNAIYRRDPEAHYFLSWTWMFTWFATRSLPWFVLAAKPRPEGETYVAFFPIQLRLDFEKELGFHNVLTMGASYFAPYTGILCDPKLQAAVLPAFAARLRTLGWARFQLDDALLSPDRRRLLLEGFPASEFSVTKAQRFAHVTRAGASIDHDVYVYVRLPRNFEDFVNGNLGTRTRRNIRLYLRRLDAGGEYRVTHPDETTIERDLEIFYELWQRQWASINPGYATFTIESSRRMLAACFCEGSHFFPILWKGDKPVAGFIAFIDRRRNALVCLLGARDLTEKNPSPGQMLHGYNLRWAIANGIGLYDLGTGDYAYKYLFGADENLVERFEIRTRTGRNIGERLNPLSLDTAAARATDMVAAGDLSNAAIACRQILAAQPDNPVAAGLYATIRQMQLPMDGVPDCANNAGNAFELHRAGNLAEAERQYRAVLAAEPGNFDAIQRLGVLLLQKRDLKGAEAEMRRALELRPDSASAYCNYGNIRAMAGDLAGALVSFDRAIRQEPRFAIAFNNRGNILRRIGRLVEALADFEQALALQPDHPQAQEGRLAILKHMEKERG